MSDVKITAILDYAMIISAGQIGHPDRDLGKDLMLNVMN